jgi:colanic acid/amylovoran biosynthesis protein
MELNKKYKQSKVSDILIVNVHSSQNAGDHALLTQTISYLEEAFGHVSFRIMVNWPEEAHLKSLGHELIVSPWRVIGTWNKNKKPRFQALSLIIGIFWLFLYRIDVLKLFIAIIPEKWLLIFQSYTKTDLVVGVSGNQLFSSGSYGWSLFVVGLPFLLARFFKKDTIIFPQSIGPINSKIEKKYVHFLYNNVKKVFVRDLVSLELVNSLKITKSDPTFMHDVAFTIQPASRSESLSILKSYGFSHSDRNLGMTIISAMPSYLSSEIMQNYYQSIADSLSTLVNQHQFQTYLFLQVHGPTEDENDFNGIEQVIDRLSLPTINNIRIIDKKMTPHQLKACYGLMDIFIASRLHSGIFSLSMEVPTLFIGYLHKTAGILMTLTMEEYIIDLKNVSSLKITNNLTSMWAAREEIKDKIRSEMETVTKDLAKFPRLTQKGLEKNDTKSTSNHKRIGHRW